MFESINADNYWEFPAISNSDLGWLQSLWMKEEKKIDLTVAYANGTLIDCMITEPHRVNYYKHKVKDEPYQYTKAEFDNSIKMRDAFYKDEFCKQFVKQCLFQHISYNPKFEVEYDGFKFNVPAKAKWDLFPPSIDLSGDIKSTACTTQKQCEEAARYFEYDRGRAWYMDLEGRNNDILIFISKVNYKIFKIPIKKGDDFYKSGKMKYQSLAYKWWYLFGN